MQDMSGRTPIDAMVAAALRIAATRMHDARDRHELTVIAEGISTRLHEDNCPLCGHATCDYLCPLTQARAEARKRVQA